MKSGPRPKPSALKIAKGEKKNRINFNEPKFTKVGIKDSAPPPGLDALAIDEWNRIFPELKKSGALCRTDRQSFAGYCHAYSVWRNAVEVMTNYPPMVWKNKLGVETKMPLVFLTPNGMIQQIPAVNIARQWGAAMLRFAAELGLTPSSRTGIMGIDPEKEKDDSLLAVLMGDGSNVIKE